MKDKDIKTADIVDILKRIIKQEVLTWKYMKVVTFGELKKTVPSCCRIQELRKALSELVTEKVIIEPYHDVYARNVETRFGPVMPPMDNIASKVAELFHEHIMPDGYHALNNLGLSRQIPMVYGYVTDGKSRTFMIHDFKVTFIHVPEWCFKIDNPVWRMLIQAIRIEGRKNIRYYMKNKDENESLQFNSGVNRIMLKNDFSFGWYDVQMSLWNIPQWIRKYLDFVYHGVYQSNK